MRFVGVNLVNGENSSLSARFNFILCQNLVNRCPATVSLFYDVSATVSSAITKFVMTLAPPLFPLPLAEIARRNL